MKGDFNKSSRKKLGKIYFGPHILLWRSI